MPRKLFAVEYGAKVRKAGETKKMIYSLRNQKPFIQNPNTCRQHHFLIFDFGIWYIADTFLKSESSY